MPKFHIGCEWTMRGYIEVVAKNLEAAKDRLDDIPLEKMHGEYVDDSFRILKGKDETYPLQINEVEVASGSMIWESDGTIRHYDHSGNCTELWRVDDPYYDENKSTYFPDHVAE